MVVPKPYLISHNPLCVLLTLFRWFTIIPWCACSTYLAKTHHHPIAHVGWSHGFTCSSLGCLRSLVQAHSHSMNSTWLNSSITSHMVISSCLVQAHVLVRPTSYGHFKILVYAWLFQPSIVFQVHLLSLSCHWCLVHESLFKSYLMIHLGFAKILAHAILLSNGPC